MLFNAFYFLKSQFGIKQQVTAEVDHFLLSHENTLVVLCEFAERG